MSSANDVQAARPRMLPIREARAVEAGAPQGPAGHFDTVFETDAWRHYVEATQHEAFAPRHLTLTSGRRVTIASYLVERRFGRWQVLYSIPPFYYGSLRSDGPLTRADLADLAHRLSHAADLHSLTLAIHPLDGCAAACEAAWQPYVLARTATHVLDLTAVTSPTDGPAGSKHQRRKVRQALRSGVKVTRTTDPAAVAQYYPVYLDAAARWGLTDVEPPEMLLKMPQYLEPYFTLWLAHAGQHVIGGLIVLSCGTTAMAVHAASLSASWDLHPNNLLFGTAIAAAQAEGRRYFDFLPSNRLRGVEVFKERFGAQRLPYSVYRIPNAWYAALSGFKHRLLEHPTPPAQERDHGPD